MNYVSEYVGVDDDKEERMHRGRFMRFFYQRAECSERGYMNGCTQRESVFQSEKEQCLRKLNYVLGGVGWSVSATSL